MKKTSLSITALAAVLAIAPATAQDAAATPDPAQIERGKALFDYWCATCHGVGPGHPGTQALDYRYQGALPGALAERPGLTPALVEVFVRNGISIMPFFRKTEIDDAELADIGAYLSRPTVGMD